MGPLLSDLQMLEWQELTVDRRKWNQMSKHQDSLVLQAQEVGLRIVCAININAGAWTWRGRAEERGGLDGSWLAMHKLWHK